MNAFGINDMVKVIGLRNSLGSPRMGKMVRIGRDNGLFLGTLDRCGEFIHRYTKRRVGYEENRMSLA